MGKLINRIPGSHLLISSLASLAMSTSILKTLPGKLDIKRHSPSILYLLKKKCHMEAVAFYMSHKVDVLRRSRLR